MPRRSDSRKRMLRTAATLFQRQGYAATGWRQVIAESATPWGSQSHHFPGGKQQLATEALQRAGTGYEQLIRAAFADSHPADAVAMWTQAAAANLEATGWAEGCPVATVALEMAHDHDDIADACDGAFTSWQTAMTERFVEFDMTVTEADRLATLVLASIEGALLLARTRRDARPLTVVGEELGTMLRSKLVD